MRYITAGESHGPELTAIVSGVPAGLEISEKQINSDLARRQSGYGRGGRQTIERDCCHCERRPFRQDHRVAGDAGGAQSRLEELDRSHGGVRRCAGRSAA